MTAPATPHFVSASCHGETCRICSDDSPATHKVGEEVMHDDPVQMRHNLTAYVCCFHYRLIMGEAVPCAWGTTKEIESDAIRAVTMLEEHHANQETEAEAMGYVEQSRRHGDEAVRLLTIIPALGWGGRLSHELFYDLNAHLQAQAEWSEATFGPGLRVPGTIAHVRKELAEIEREPDDVKEWIDVALLAFDGAWRALKATGTDTASVARLVVRAFRDKQDVNTRRTWPDWRTVPQDEPVEHDRSFDAMLSSEIGYEACWRVVEGKPGNCRAPKGHAGECHPV